jgi:hypothetical protein
MTAELGAHRAPRQAPAGGFTAQICTGDPSVEANWTDAAESSRATNIQLNGLPPGKLCHVLVCGLARLGGFDLGLNFFRNASG